LLTLPRFAAASGGYAYSEAGGGTWTAALPTGFNPFTAARSLPPH